MGLAVAVNASFAQSITIDGQTATTVTAAPGGNIAVTVAPANNAGTSHNTYSNFNVPNAGVTLKNGTSNARLIVNEVTSTAKTDVLGAITVEGPKADVVIANPNGIYVNGASFTNTGNAAFIAGRNNGTPSDFLVDSGSVTVGPDGVSGGSDGLYIHGGSVIVDGNLAMPGGSLSVSAGSGVVRTGLTGLNQWLTYTPDGRVPGRIVVSSGAMLSGGSISMVAGGVSSLVEANGVAMASAGNFTIQSDGQVRITGQLTAAETLSLSARGSVTVEGRAAKRAELNAVNEAVQIESGASVALSNVDIEARRSSSSNFFSAAAVSVLAQEKIEASDVHVDTSVDSIEFVSETDIELSDVDLTSASVINAAGEGDVIVKESTLKATANIALSSVEKSVAVLGSDLEGEAGVRLEAGQDISLSPADDKRSRVVSEGAGVTLLAGRDFRNSGALVQGLRQTAGDANSKGGITVRSERDTIIETVAEDMIGSLFSTRSSLSLDAGRNLTNVSGRILAESDLDIQVGGIFHNQVAQTGETVPGVPIISPVLSEYGSYAHGREIAQIVSGGDVSIQAGQFFLDGGSLSGANVSVNAQDIRIQPERFGRFIYKKNCFLFFCQPSGFVDITHDGGSVVARGNLRLTASNEIAVNGGFLSGDHGVFLTAETVAVRANIFPDGYFRPPGLGGLFFGTHWRQMDTFANAVITSSLGALTINAASETIFEGGTVLTEDGILASQGYRFNQAPSVLSEQNRRNLGFFSWILR